MVTRKPLAGLDASQGTAGGHVLAPGREAPGREAPGDEARGAKAQAAGSPFALQAHGQPAPPVCRTTSIFMPASARRASAWCALQPGGRQARHGHSGGGWWVKQAWLPAAILHSIPAAWGSCPRCCAAASAMGAASQGQAAHRTGGGRPCIPQQAWPRAHLKAAICCFSCFSLSFFILMASFSAALEHRRNASVEWWQ